MNTQSFTRQLAAIFILVMVMAAQGGCAGNTKTAVQKKPETKAKRSRSQGFLWIGYIKSAEEILFMPLRISDVELVEWQGALPIFRLDMKTGKSARLANSDMAQAAVVSDSRGEALFAFASLGPSQTALRIYSPKLRRLAAVPAKPGGYDAFVLSPDSNRVAASHNSVAELWRWVNWQVEVLQKKPNVKQVRLRTDAVLIDLAKRKVSFTGIQGVPLCWSVDGQTACFRTAKGILGYNVASGKKTTISPRMDIGYAKWSAPLNGYVALIFRKGKLVLDLTDQIFTTKRTLGDCPSSSANLIMSPEGRKIAYCSDGAYFIFALEDGTLSQLMGQTGDLDPAWLDEDSLIIGDSTGEINVVNIDGSTEKTYHIAALKREPKAN